MATVDIRINDKKILAQIEGTLNCDQPIGLIPEVKSGCDGQERLNLTNRGAHPLGSLFILDLDRGFLQISAVTPTECRPFTMLSRSGEGEVQQICDLDYFPGLKVEGKPVQKNPVKTRGFRIPAYYSEKAIGQLAELIGLGNLQTITSQIGDLIREVDSEIPFGDFEEKLAEQRQRLQDFRDQTKAEPAGSLEKNPPSFTVDEENQLLFRFYFVPLLRRVQTLLGEGLDPKQRFKSRWEKNRFIAARFRLAFRLLRVIDAEEGYNPLKEAAAEVKSHHFRRNSVARLVKEKIDLFLKE